MVHRMPPPTREPLGPLIRRCRQRSGLSLEALAERVGCAKSYLSLIENGHKKPRSDELIVSIAEALGVDPPVLLEAAAWERTPGPVRRELEELERARTLGRRMASILANSGIDDAGRLGGALDRAHRTGELKRLIEQLSSGSSSPDTEPIELPREVPLINSVAAGYPADFTDLGFPARIADEYVRCPDLHDPDAFAARVVGDSMLPEYREGDIVIFSPARDPVPGSDCFARLEPDHETTFKRVYFEIDAEGRECIRLQPINNAYPPKVLPREEVAGLYPAVSVMRSLM
jgi:SOS-response transcriptional repressor LexA